MEELTIEEKKYVSTKRAAQLTGYAKDYVGQLCREGRVPARLVGRSWYVLESALQDHRFGTPEAAGRSEDDERPASKAAAYEAWDAPRYEAQRGSELPPLPQKEEEVSQETSQIRETLEDAWQEWFSSVGGSEQDKAFEEPIVAAEEAPIVSEAAGAVSEPESVSLEEEAHPVPIRAYYAPKREEPVPGHSAPPLRVQRKALREPAPALKPFRKGRSSVLLVGVRAVAVLVAAFLLFSAVSSTGYFDEYANSVGQAAVIAGVNIYQK